MIIDTHTHYNFPEIEENWQEHWKKAQEHGVSSAVLVGTNMTTSQEVITLAEQNPHFFATVGVHPHDASDLNSEKLEQLAHHTKVVAIGEIGLDYFRLDTTQLETKKIIEQQKEVFIAQLELANKLNLPVSIHVRDDNNEAYDDTLSIIKEHTPLNNFVLHCVSGPEHYIKQMISVGAYFGFDGNITYKNADSIRDILKMVPRDRVVVETDAPYLPPVPYRGKVCEPWMISITAEYIEKEFGVDKEMIRNNSRNLYSKIG